LRSVGLRSVATRPKERSNVFVTIGAVMPLTGDVIILRAACISQRRCCSSDLE